jgi:hypothetical protein
MRLNFLITLQILFYFPIFAQETDTVPSFPMIAYWNKNEVLNYELICGKKKLVNAAVKDSTALTTAMTLTIVDSTDKKYLIEIAYDSDHFSQDLGLKSKEADQVINKFKAQRFKYETNEMGEFKDFKDLAKVKNFYKDVLKLMEKDDRYKNVPKESFDKMKSLMLSDEYIASKSFEEILLMHSFYGRTWPVDSLMEFEDELANSVNPMEPYPANSTFLFTYDEQDPEIGYIFYNTTVNEGALNGITKNILMQMGLPVDKAKDFSKIQMTMFDTNTFVVEVSTGTILSLYRERIVKVDDTENVTFLEVNLKN